MAGMEVVVRPVVLPDIRPTPKRSLPPEDDPTQGFCEIRGNGATFVSLPYSFSASASTSKPTEQERRVDEARVYQKNDNGKVNKKNFVDIHVANRIKFKTGKLPASSVPMTGDDFSGRTYSDVFAEATETRYYRRARETDNIEIRKKDQTLTNFLDPAA